MTHDAPALGAIFLITIGSVVAALLSAEQWLGWLLLGATLIVPLGFSSIREDWRLATVLYLVIACHHGLAMLLTVGEVRPLDLWDASYFDHLASQAAQGGRGDLGEVQVSWELGYRTYVNLLSGVYVVNNNFFTGAQVSVLFAVVALLLSVQIAREVNVPTERLWWVACAGGIPGSLIFFSVTYRESCQIFFLILAVWAAIRMLSQGETRWWFVFGVALMCLGILHKALFLYSLFMVTLIMVFMVITYRRSYAVWGIGVGIACFCGAAGITVWVILGPVEFLEPVIRLIGTDLFDRITIYRERMVNRGAPRTDYKLLYDWEDLPSVLMTFSAIYLHYLFAPFSGISQWVDLYPVAESWMRFILLVIAGFGLFKIPPGERKLLLLLLIVYLSLTFLWSVGTTNYGQALRHHTMTNWLLFVLFAAVGPRIGGHHTGAGRQEE